MNDDFDNDDWLNDGDEPSDDSEDQDDAQDFDWLLDESDDSDPDQQAGRLGVTGELSWLQDSGQSADVASRTIHLS